jgi:hypothetical protein
VGHGDVGVAMDGGLWQSVLWHTYGGRHSPPCAMCKLADEEAVHSRPALIVPGNSLLRALKQTTVHDLPVTPGKDDANG